MSTKRQHKAAYTRDKKKGGYLIRVIGPQAGLFAGRTVPVTTRNDQEHDETLGELIWSGIDTGNAEIKGTGLPVALYTFTAKPKEAVEVAF